MTGATNGWWRREARATAVTLGKTTMARANAAGREAGETMIEQASWHTLPIGDVAARLEASDAGLTGAEAQARLEQYGPNRLPRKAPPSWWG